MENTKKTIAQKFNEVIAVINGLDVDGKDGMIEFLEDRKDKTIHKSGSRKPSKTQIEMQDVIMPLVLDTLAEVGKPITVGELIKVDAIAEFMTEGGNALTSSKVTSALTKLRDAKKVTRDDVKGKAYYALA